MIYEKRNKRIEAAHFDGTKKSLDAICAVGKTHAEIEGGGDRALRCELYTHTLPNPV